MKPRIYVAAPYEDANLVRQTHLKLEQQDFAPVSFWAIAAHGPEALNEQSAKWAIKHNDEDLESAAGVLALCREGAGGEMYAEITRALIWGKPVFWVGHRRLSAYRHGVTLCDDIDDAIDALDVLR